jgi:hypothetical protein
MRMLTRGLLADSLLGSRRLLRDRAECRDAWRWDAGGVGTRAARSKEARFDHNAEFDFAVFQQTFDFFIARSIWSHASKEQIETMLDAFLRTSESHSVFLTSYCRATLFNKDYTGLEWVGRSHESNTPGIVYHSCQWIEGACAKRKLVARELTDKICNFGDQTWILVKHANT